jgi:isopenicillin N synthase-like dioxygenase
MEIPVVDVLGVGGFESVELGKVINEAFQSCGFLILKNTGFNFPLIKDLYIAAQQIFDLPDRIKMQFERPQEGVKREVGYLPFQCEIALTSRDPDLKEGWSIRREGNHIPNVFPGEHCPVFEIIAMDCFGLMDEMSVKLAKLIGNNLFLSKSLPYSVSKGDNLMRVVRYPVITGYVPGLRSAPHQDINLFSLLPNSEIAGLQVKLPGGEWIDVPYIENSFILNAGKLLARYTNGFYKAAWHRVINLPAERMIMAFFAHPQRDFVIAREGMRIFTAGELLDIELGRTMVKPV